MSVEALSCPNCGAGVSSDRTRCEFCKTRLKTLACVKCLGLMFLGSKFCGRCGALAAPVDVELEATTGDCPRCRNSLEALRVGETSFEGCSSCDGLWVGPETFEAICLDQEKQSAIIKFLENRKPQLNALTKVSYVPCPDCGQLMNRNNFAKVSGVVVDICKPDGVWFDFDELPAIVEFVRKGGMDLARQREKDEIAAEREDLRSARRKRGASHIQLSPIGSLSQSDESGVRGFVQSLFD